MNIALIEILFAVASVCSLMTCAWVQKTKGILPSSKWVSPYSFICNMVLGVLICISFTDIAILMSLWVGFFSFLGADQLYKAFEDKWNSYSDIIKKKTITIPTENIIETEE